MCICLTSESIALSFSAFPFMVQPSPKAQWFGNHTIFLKKKKKKSSINQPTNYFLKSFLKLCSTSTIFFPNSRLNYQVSVFSSFQVLVFHLYPSDFSTLVDMLNSWSVASVIERLIGEQWAQTLEPENLDETPFPPEMIECFAHLHGRMTQAISASLFSSEKGG